MHRARVTVAVPKTVTRREARSREKEWSHGHVLLVLLLPGGRNSYLVHTSVQLGTRVLGLTPVNKGNLPIFARKGSRSPKSARDQDSEQPSGAAVNCRKPCYDIEYPGYLLAKE
eukprot:694911-Rhodomonas_salina.4